MELNKKISSFADDFYSKKVGDKTKYFVKEKSELYDTVRELHSGMLPNDWIFMNAYHILNSLSDYENINDDTAHEVADSLVDIYNHDLIEWFKEHRHWIDEAQEQGLLGSIFCDSIKQMQIGQYCQLYYMTNTLIDKIKEL
jgi:hypothetical protein